MLSLIEIINIFIYTLVSYPICLKHTKKNLKSNNYQKNKI